MQCTTPESMRCPWQPGYPKRQRGDLMSLQWYASAISSTPCLQLMPVLLSQPSWAGVGGGSCQDVAGGAFAQILCAHMLEPGPRCSGILCLVQVQLGGAEPLKSATMMYCQQNNSCLMLRSELCAPRGCQMPTFLHNSHPTLKNSILSEKKKSSCLLKRTN